MSILHRLREIQLRLMLICMDLQRVVVGIAVIVVGVAPADVYSSWNNLSCL